MNTQEVEKKFIGAIPLAAIKESKLNPRKTFGDLDDLAASIKAQGVISPILVRKLQGDEYELVYGARRIRAAEKAGLREIPAMLADCSEEEAQELRIIENAQRADVHPLHEAQAIQKLLDKGKGITVDVVAGRLGRTPAYLRRRLELLRLPKEAQEAFLEGKMVLGVAQVLVGVAGEEARERAWKVLKEAMERKFDDDKDILTSPDRARNLIRDEVLPELAAAPFKLDQAELIKGVVACTVCPHRTTAQADLFGGDQGAGNCLQPKCYKSKVDAAFEQKAEEVRKSGKGVILSSAENKKALHQYGDGLSHEFQAETDESYKFDAKSGQSRSKKVSAIMKGLEDKRVLVKGKNGEPILAYRRKDIEAAVGKAFRQEKTPAQKAKAQDEKREAALEKFTAEFIRNRIRAEAMKLSAAELIMALGRHALNHASDYMAEAPWDHTAAGAVFARRGIADVKAWKALSENEQFAFFRELLLEQEILGEIDEYHIGMPGFEQDLKPFNLKLGDLEKVAKSSFEAQEKEKAETVFPKGKPAAAPLANLIQKPRKLRKKKGGRK